MQATDVKQKKFKKKRGGTGGRIEGHYETLLDNDNSLLIIIKDKKRQGEINVHRSQSRLFRQGPVFYEIVKNLHITL